MKSPFPHRRVAATVVSALAFVLAGGFAASTSAADKDAGKPMKPSKVVEAMLDDDAKDFFETAASSNMFEIQASQLAEKQGTDPSVHKFAAQMVKDHQQAGSELKALAKKKGVTLPTALLGRHQRMLDDLKNEKVGKDFDEDYRDKMVTSHKEAVSLFDEASKDSKDADIKAFAAKTLPKLEMHGGMAKELPNG